MGVGEYFGLFCANLTVNNRSDIAIRARAIARRLNLDFRNLDSETSYSRYVGSYGRGTAIRGFSDLDFLYELPSEVYYQYDAYLGNGQSALLQAVRNSIRKRYPSTDVGGDGQVVVVNFSDGMRFEVVPAFVNKSDSYTYPDSNGGGGWKTTNPLPEIAAVAEGDRKWNNNLTQLCRMARAWRRTWNVPMGGLLIDTLAFQFLSTWSYSDKSYYYYDWMSRDFFNFLADQDTKQTYWRALGSGQFVYRKGLFEYKAKQCYNLAVEAISKETAGYSTSAKGKWREIYGSFFPS